MNDRAIIGSLLSLLTRDRSCSVCHCEGDSCKLETGEKCVLPDGMNPVCSNPRCIQEAHFRKKRHQRDRKRQVVRRRTA